MKIRNLRKNSITGEVTKVVSDKSRLLLQTEKIALLLPKEAQQNFMNSKS